MAQHKRRKMADLQFDQLPTECLFSILEYVPATTIVSQVSLLSKFWYQIARNDSLWKQLCDNFWEEYESEADRPYTKDLVTSWQPYYFYRFQHEEADRSLMELSKASVALWKKKQDFHPRLHPTCSLQSRLGVLQQINWWLSRRAERIHSLDGEMATRLDLWINYALLTGSQDIVLANEAMTIFRNSSILCSSEENFPQLRRRVADSKLSQKLAHFSKRCLKDLVFPTFPMGNYVDQSNEDPMGTQVKDHVIPDQIIHFVNNCLETSFAWVENFSSLHRRDPQIFIKPIYEGTIAPLLGSVTCHIETSTQSKHANQWEDILTSVGSILLSIGDGIGHKVTILQIVFPAIKAAENCTDWHVTLSTLNCITILAESCSNHVSTMIKSFILPKISSENPYVRRDASETIGTFVSYSLIEPDLKPSILMQLQKCIETEQHQPVIDRYCDIIVSLVFEREVLEEEEKSQEDYEPLLKTIISKISPDCNSSSLLKAASSILGDGTLVEKYAAEFLPKLKPFFNKESDISISALGCFASMATYADKQVVKMVVELTKSKLTSEAIAPSSGSSLSLTIIPLSRLIGSKHITQEDVPWIVQAFIDILNLTSEVVVADDAELTEEWELMELPGGNIAVNEKIDTAKENVLKMLEMSLCPSSDDDHQLNFDEYIPKLVQPITNAIFSMSEDVRLEACNPFVLEKLFVKSQDPLATFDLIYRAFTVAFTRDVNPDSMIHQIECLASLFRAYSKMTGNLPVLDRINSLVQIIDMIAMSIIRSKSIALKDRKEAIKANDDVLTQQINTRIHQEIAVLDAFTHLLDAIREYPGVQHMILQSIDFDHQYKKKEDEDEYTFPILMIQCNVASLPREMLLANLHGISKRLLPRLIRICRCSENEELLQGAAFAIGKLAHFPKGLPEAFVGKIGLGNFQLEIKLRIDSSS
eukprot:TRINITY_DN7377_c0_g1_i1.p1 TRINITY_DN7377_c0_g1~~TRINITY_DN7377_c0_g1_i1.p1  ORF type:complete len:931 (-),score=172.56 TRINITY_DN7377_c0_g1_i1:465-3257(-)